MPASDGDGRGMRMKKMTSKNTSKMRGTRNLTGCAKCQVPSAKCQASLASRRVSIFGSSYNTSPHSEDICNIPRSTQS